MGIVSDRQRRRGRRRIRRHALRLAFLLVAGAALLGTVSGFDRIAPAARKAVQAFAPGKSMQAELALPQREIYALQLGVYDSGERAAQEAKRLNAQGISCVVWQREKMRIICSAALDRESLDLSAAKGQDACVVKEILPQVKLRLTADERDMADVQQLLLHPDNALLRLLGDKQENTLEAVLLDTRTLAQEGAKAHPENALYTQLAQRLLAWCDELEAMLAQGDAQAARSYAAVTMCTLCRELRLLSTGG